VTAGRRRATAAAVALALPAVALTLVVTVVERPFAPPRRPDGAARRAAVAIRDDVVPFQKWGTRAFTLPVLERCYDRVAYFTQTSTDDRRDELVACLTRAAEVCDSIDVFLLAHGNRFVDWAAALDPSTTSKLRLVYDTGCGDATQAARWLALGADAYVGHVGLSQSPVFYVYFLRRWAAGWRVDAAVASANAETERVLRIVGPVGLDRAGVEDLVDGSRAVLAGDENLRIGDE
jgi:hypothetical protein